jgi:hypothetical protein
MLIIVILLGLFRLSIFRPKIFGLQDTPLRQKQWNPKASLFKTPKPLRTSAAQMIDSPTNNQQVRQIEMKARRGSIAKEDLQALFFKLSGLTIRSMADSEIQSNLLSDLTKKKSTTQQGEKKRFPAPIPLDSPHSTCNDQISRRAASRNQTKSN